MVNDNHYHFIKYVYHRSNEWPASGVLANKPPDYSHTRQPLEIHFGPPDKRPVFIPSFTQGEFYTEYAGGLAAKKWHSIVERYAK